VSQLSRGNCDYNYSPPPLVCAPGHGRSSRIARSDLAEGTPIPGQNTVGLDGGFAFFASLQPPVCPSGVRWPLNPKEKAAGDAIRAMGTNSLPTLVAIIRQKENKSAARFIAWVNKQRFLKVKIYSTAERRAQAYAALQELGYIAIPAWTEILLDEKLPVYPREFAAFSLANLRNSPGFAAAIPTNSSAYAAMTVIIEQRDEQAWHGLLRGLNSTNSLIRSNAAINLGGFGPRAKGAIPGLIEHASDPDPGARKACLRALRDCEPDPALGLIRALQYERGYSRAGAAASLGLLKQRPTESVQALMSAALDSESYVRETAISALSDFGTNAFVAMPVLANACSDTNKFVRRAATNALAQLTARIAVPSEGDPSPSEPQ